MLRNSTHRDPLVALLALLVYACSGSPNDGSSGPEPGIEQVSEALGGFTQLWNGANGETPLYVNSDWTAFKHVSAGCDQVDAIETVSGIAVTLAPLPTCGAVTAAGGDSTLFVGTSAQKIYSVRHLMSGGAGMQFDYTWDLVVNTSGTNISKILVDAVNVYWQDSTGIYRAPRTGGTGTKIGFSNR